MSPAPEPGFFLDRVAGALVRWTNSGHGLVLPGARAVRRESARTGGALRGAAGFSGTRFPNAPARGSSPSGACGVLKHLHPGISTATVMLPRQFAIRSSTSKPAFEPRLTLTPTALLHHEALYRPGSLIGTDPDMHPCGSDGAWHVPLRQQGAGRLARRRDGWPLWHQAQVL
jgi:hypothetical protein